MAMQKMAQSLALRKYRKRAEKQARSLDFSAHLEGVERVLVCLPEAAEEYARILPALAGIRKAFPRAHVTLLQSSAIPVSTEMVRGFQLVAWGAADLDRLGGPGVLFRRRLFAESFGLALDLNQEPRFFTLAVMMESGAPVRAGYAGSMRDELYTFLVRPGTQDAAQALQTLLTYLGRPESERRR
ncbi:MAG TPA: hypothetical protein PLF89_09995 [bacterium]|nr:hypothetical protein [bacterium]